MHLDASTDADTDYDIIPDHGSDVTPDASTNATAYGRVLPKHNQAVQTTVCNSQQCERDSELSREIGRGLWTRLEFIVVDTESRGLNDSHDRSIHS